MAKKGGGSSGHDRDNGPSSPVRQDTAIALVSALAKGEAAAADVAHELRRRKLDAIDVLVAVLERASKAKRPSEVTTAVQIQRFSRPSDSGSKKSIIQRIPHVPVLLNGTLYDPQDLRRFNGAELHFIAADDHLLAIDDVATIARFWEFSYISASLESRRTETDYGGISPQFTPPTPQIPEPGGELPPFGQGSSSGQSIPSTYLYEDVDFKGACLTLPNNRAFYDLTDVGRGFLGLGDWNDVISSVQMLGTTLCILFEHVHRGGASLTLHGGTHNLVPFGWNDRVSSVETW